MQLIQCPFCASSRLKMNHEPQFNRAWVSCRGCGCEGPLCADVPAAEDAWNTRGDVPTMQPAASSPSTESAANRIPGAP